MFVAPASHLFAIECSFYLQVVNLTRVTEKFMSSLLASMTGGVVSLDSDVTSSAGIGAGAASGMQVRAVMVCVFPSLVPLLPWYVLRCAVVSDSKLVSLCFLQDHSALSTSSGTKADA